MKNKILRYIKRMLFIIGILFGVLLLTAIVFINFSPQFGGTPDKEQKKIYSQSDNFEDGKFIIRTPISTSENRWEAIQKVFKKKTHQRPLKEIEPLVLDSTAITSYSGDETKVTWFGHSTFLLQMQGATILLDPMLGDYASPLPITMTKRFNTKLPIAIEKLPFIDFVIFSHDHYDHLDYSTIKKIKDNVGKFFVPLGLSAHLTSWGVEKEKIEELDWWDMTSFGDIQLVCTPAIHFSGRGLFDQGATLWASWVIKGKNDKIYFSGDSGYGNHFKTIGDKYGPFDLVLMECGQYDKDWKNIHMFPEETVQAAVDVKGEVLVPIHWGSFKLANHIWTDPIERVVKKAQELNINISTPRIGETIIIHHKTYPETQWWVNYD